MHVVDAIRKKRDGGPLAPDDIDAFVHGATTGAWTDYQLSAMLMAIFLRGMDRDETAHLTAAMVRSGTRLDWSHLHGPTADKHSTGGVGDKTSPILAPLAAACGVYVPMMSGRGLGHTGGTLDKLEAIPGFRVHIPLDEFREAVGAVGCAMIGQTEEIAPADKKLYALRDVTATVESIPLITSSIMSKKIAEGVGALVLDVKCGHGAFMKTTEEARALAESLVQAGDANQVHTEVLLTDMDFPLGRAVGNALEIRECIDVLKGEGDARLRTLSVTLAAYMLLLAGAANDLTAATAKVIEALDSGAGLEKFREMIVRQGGDGNVVDDPSQIPVSPKTLLVHAERPGYVTELHAEETGRAAMVLGAGRAHSKDVVDPAVGVRLLVERGEYVNDGQPWAEIHYRDEATAKNAEAMLNTAIQIGDEMGELPPLILETFD